MAGTSYRGLTIRIGGDVTKLTKALTIANRAITDTQGQLRRLNQAAKFDPGRDLLSDRLDLIKRKSLEVSERMSVLKEAVEQVGSRAGNGGTIEELANNTKDAALEASHALDEYNALDTELEKLWRRFFDASGTQVKELFSKEEIDAEIDRLVEIGEVSQKDADKFDHMRKAWSDAAEKLDSANLVAQFVDLKNEITRAESEAAALGRELADLTIQRDMETKFGKIDEEIDHLAASTNIASTYVEHLDKALDLDPSNVDLARKRMEALETQAQLAEENIGKTSEKLKMFSDEAKSLVSEKGIVGVANGAKQAQERFREAAANVKVLEGKLEAAKSRATKLANEGKFTSDEFIDATQTVDKLENELKQAKGDAEALRQEAAKFAEADAYVKTAQDLEMLEAEASNARSRLRELGDAGGISRHDLADMAQSVTNVVVPALKRLAEYSIDAANQVDGAFRNMRKTVDATEEQYQALRDAAQEFSTTHFTSADEMLEIMAMGGQLGIAAENLESFSETISQIGIATNIESMDAAQNLGQLINIMDDLNVSNADRFADSLVRLGNNMPALEGDIMNITTRIASQSNIIGLTTPQVLAWSTAIASTGQKSEAAGTAISKTMVQIESAVANGGEALDTFAEVAGMDAQTFAETWESDPNTALREFIAGLTAIDDSGDSMIMKLEELGITGVRQKQTIEGLSQTLDTLDDALLMSQDAWDGVSDEWGAAGDAAREADRKAEGFSGTLQELKNSAQVLGAEIGESLTPYLKVARDVVREVYERFSGLDDKTQTLVVTLAAVGAAALPAATGVLKFAEAAEDATTWQGKLAKKIMGGAGNLVDSLGAANIAAGGLAAVGIAVLIAAEKEAYDNLSRIRYVANEIPDALNRVRDPLSLTTEELGNTSEAAWNAANSYRDFLDSLEGHTQNIQGIADSFGAQWQSLSLAEEYLRRYAGQSGLTAEEQGKLKWAVDLVNEACDTEWQVVDAANGKIEDQAGVVQDATDAINDYIAAKKQQIQLNAYEEILTELYQERAETLQELAEQQEYLAQLQSAPTSPEGSLYGGDAVAIAGQMEVVQGLTDAYDSLNDQINTYETEMGELASLDPSSFTEFSVWARDMATALGDVDPSTLQRLATEMENLGVHFDTLSGLSSDTIRDIVNRWSSGGEDLRTILAEYGVLYEDAGTGITRSMGKSGEDAVKAYKGKIAELPGQIATETRKVKNKLEEGLNQERNASNWAARTMSAYKSALNTSIDVSGVKAKLQQLDMSDRSYTWGSHLIGNLAAGMRARLGELDMVSKTAAGKISNKLGQTVAKEGPLHYTDVWGVHLMDNIISGMESRQSALERASLASAEIISDAMDVESRLAVPTMAEAPVTSLQGIVQGGNTVYIDGARINDTPAIRETTKNYLLDLARKGAM